MLEPSTLGAVSGDEDRYTTTPPSVYGIYIFFLCLFRFPKFFKRIYFNPFSDSIQILCRFFMRHILKKNNTALLPKRSYFWRIRNRRTNGQKTHAHMDRKHTQMDRKHTHTNGQKTHTQMDRKHTHKWTENTHTNE